jgi:hypothetical protein
MPIAAAGTISRRPAACHAGEQQERVGGATPRWPGTSSRSARVLVWSDEAERDEAAEERDVGAGAVDDDG